MVHLRRGALLAAVLAVGAAANAARATITVTFDEYVLGGSPNAATLAANGWIGVRINAVSDANPVGGFDLDTGSRGITGTFVQYSTTQDQLGNPTPATSTPQGFTPATAPGTTVNLQDSFFSMFTNFALSETIALAEDNDFSSHLGTNPPYDFVPLVDTLSVNYGIGTRLHGAGAFTQNQTTTVPIAFVIVPIGTQIHVVGQFADKDQAIANGFLVNQFFTATAVPEPTGLALLGAGAMALLARRRRQA